MAHHLGWWHACPKGIMGQFPQANLAFTQHAELHLTTGTAFTPLNLVSELTCFLASGWVCRTPRAMRTLTRADVN